MFGPAVNYYSTYPEFQGIQNVISRSWYWNNCCCAAIAFSWIISPVLTGLAAALIFLAARHLILRRDKAYALSFWALPFLVLVTVWINIYFALTKVNHHIDALLMYAAWTASAVEFIASVSPKISLAKKSMQNGQAGWYWLGPFLRPLLKCRLFFSLSLWAFPSCTASM